jgi:hypothetical protein
MEAILAAVIGSLVAAGASYGVSKLAGSPDQPNIPGQMMKFGGKKPETPFVMPTTSTPLQFGQQGGGSGVNPYNMPNLGAATQKALGRYMGR